MSIKVERCVGHAAAPPHSSTHRIVSLVNRVVAFRVSSKPRSYKVHPREGFIDVGGYAMLTVTSPGHYHSAASLRIDWTETNPRERNVAAAFRFGQQSGHVIHPLNSMVVYSDEKYPSALLRAHTDPWANVRRPWAVIKFGSGTALLRNSETVWRAVSTIYDALCDHHVMLEEAPLYHAVTPVDREQIVWESREQFSEANVKRSLFPVLLLVDDSDEEFAAYIRKKLSKHVYVFELSSQEMVDIASSSAQKPYPQLNEWCREFAQLVEQTEKAMRSPTEVTDLRDKPSVSEPLTSRSNALVDDWEEKHVPMLRATENMERLNASDFHDGRNDHVDFHGHGNNLSCFNGHSADKRKIASARDVEQALMYARNNRSDVNVVMDLAVPYIFNRLASPFNEIVPNIDLMQLLYIACSVRTDLKDAIDCAYMITDRILSTRYIPNVCDRFGYPSIEDPRRWNEDFSAFLSAIMHVFILIDSYNFHGEEVFDAWTTYHDVLVKLPCAFWDEEEARDWLERMAAKLEHLAHYQPPRRPTPPRDDGYGRFEDEMDQRGLGSMRDLDDALKEVFEPPLWQECELKPPPCDFRDMSVLPLNSEIIRAQKSYLRRAIIDGKYTNADHYLDIQYRLFREDLISSLRDGIAVYLVNGSTRYRRCPEDFGALSSDILISRMEAIDGLQVHQQHGTPLRYAKFTTESLSDSVVSRNLMFGQIVCISSDGFCDDLHMARIVDRESLETDGILGLSPLNEDGTIKKNCSCLLAEPNCYLEAYEHVLIALKSFSRFEPLPLERYIVYGKTDTRKPRYMRFEENVEDLLDDVEIMKFYEEQRSQNKSEQKESAKQKSSVVNDIKKFIGDESDEEEDFETPIMKPTTRVVTVGGQSRILIDSKTYEVDKLLEEYNPPNLDDSQRRSLIQALTNELAIIQGPPGTGKTYIGAEIARIMLQNRTRWGIIEPILVVAYTNNAVDEFAEKLIPKIWSDMENQYLQHDGPLAVRLGSKSECSFLKRSGFMRNDVVDANRHLQSEKTKQEFHAMLKQKREDYQRIAEASFCLYVYKRDLVSYQALVKNNVIPDRMRCEFLQWQAVHCDSFGRNLDNDETLACWLLEKAYTRESLGKDLPAEGDEEDEEDDENDDERYSVEEDEMETTGTLDDLLEDMNKKAVDCDEMDDDVYLTEKMWDIARSSSARNQVTLLRSGFKRYTQAKHPQKTRTPLDNNIVHECSEAKEAILRVNPMTPEDAANVKSVFSLTKQRRWELYILWMQQLKARVRAQIPELMQKFHFVCEWQKSVRTKQHAEVLRRSLVVFATTTGAAKERELLERLRCPIVFVEEAALILEPHTLAALHPAVEHVVLIGDHQQLRPNVAMYTLAHEYHLDVSMFERLVRNGYPYSTLQVQHRMNKDIADNIVRPYFYPNVADDACVLEYPEVPGMDKRLFFWMHEEPETTIVDSMSKSNAHEIAMVVALVTYLRKQGIEQKEITILTTYSAQTRAMKEAITEIFGQSPDGQPSIGVVNVDAFQGKENRIIILSLVRSMVDGIGFLSVKNRITVALTRARHGMYVVGNLVYLSDCSSFWRRMALDLFDKDFASSELPIRCQRHGNVQRIEHPSEFAEKSPEGGCLNICDADLPCGHKCPRRCHPTDDHESFQCKQPCSRRCKNEQYRHPCRRACYEDCGECFHVVTARLLCGHSTNVTCAMVAKAVCHERCKNILGCGHQCRATCGKPCDTKCLEPVTVSNDVCNHTWEVPCSEADVSRQCPVRCPEILPCGHNCAELCGQPCTFDCKESVQRTLSCGHRIRLPCCEDESKKLCEVKVLRDLERCGHSAMMPCHAGTDPSQCPIQCNRELPCGHKCLHTCGQCFQVGECKCDAVCAKLLDCGHRCSKRCGEPCEPCMETCLNSCKHQGCGDGGPNQVFKYARKCSQLCALCPKFCDNSCQHRSCNKKCYEVCDVKPCDQPCTAKLSCGHGCLGMCGETCPTICGTCNKQTYVRLLKEFIGADATLTRLPRVIQLERCRHMFPVEYLDKHAKAVQSQSEPFVCPITACKEPITGVQRYAKLFKKRVLDRYQRRSAASSPTAITSEQAAVIEKTKSILSLERTRLLRTNTTMRTPDPQLYSDVESLLADAHNAITTEMQSKPELYDFWREYSRCVILLSTLLRSFVVFHPVKTKSLTNLFDVIAAPLFSRSKLRTLFVKEARQLCDWLMSYGKTRLTGVIVPRVRYLAVRVMFYRKMTALGHAFAGDSSNLPSDERAESIRRCATRFLHSTPEQDVLQIFDEFEDLIANTLKELGIRVIGDTCGTRTQSGFELPAF